MSLAFVVHLSRTAEVEICSFMPSAKRSQFSPIKQLLSAFILYVNIGITYIRLVTRTGRCEHITPVLRELHWLPVRRREFQRTHAQ